MGKEGSYSGGAKVYESKKEKKRRLLANNDLETDEFAVTPCVEIVQAGNGLDSRMPSIVLEKGGGGEKRVTRTDVFGRKLGGEGSKEKFMLALSAGECRGIGIFQPEGEEAKSESADTARDQTDVTGASSSGLASLNLSCKMTGTTEENVLESKPGRKRSMELCEDEFSRKKIKTNHMDSFDDQTEKNGVDKSLFIVEHMDECMDSAKNDVQVSKVPVSWAEERDGKGSSDVKLRRGRRKSSKSEGIRCPGRSGLRNRRGVKDARFSDNGVKEDENGGRSQVNYIRAQGRSVARVLQSGKEVAVPDDAFVQLKEQESTRRSRSSLTNKLSTSNQRQVGRKPISNIKRWKGTRKASSKDACKSSISKKNQKILSPKKGSKKAKLLHSNPSLDVRNENNTKESDANRGTLKRELREQIKNILLDAGWKIELRPRMNRDYEDSVYVSPSGSGYWSIVKAYDVYVSEFQSACDKKEDSKKQSNAPAGGSTYEEEISTFAVIPPELILLLKRKIINKRRTKKEMEEVKRRKGMEDAKLKDGIGRRKKKAKEGTKIKRSKDKGTRDAGGGTIGTKRKLIVRNSKRKGCSLLVRGSNEYEGSEKGDYTPYVWKRTVLSWMIDLGLLTAYGKVRYMNKRRSRALLGGRITRDGIQCSCCGKIFSVSKFEIHAGSKLHQPYENICMEVSGISLLQCQINAWEKEESKKCIFFDVDTDGDDPNDDTCGICGDGGDLICCDSCPSTFHLGCLGIEMLPTGDWHCSNCSCKFCGAVHDSASQCGSAPNSLFTCSQCEQKYHKGCVPEGDAVPNGSNSSNNMFCGRSCRKVFRKLQKLIGVRNKLETGFYWSIVHRCDDLSMPLPRMAQRVESNSKVAIAYAVMDECFVPIIDQRSGINLIHNVVYNCGANFNRLNFSGFYTFILERGDEIIAAASVRIHDTRLAEMPFIGTRSMYRRQGMCRRLLKGIESALRSLCINKLIIPAISELTETWTTVFGFKPLEISQKEEVKSLNILVFPDTGLLQKSLMKDSNKQRTNPELENKHATQNTVKADENFSADDIIDSKESKCDTKAIQPNPPIPEQTNFLPEASGCNVQLCGSIEGAANIESNDIQYAYSSSNHVKKDASPRNSSNEMLLFIDEPKKEVENVKNAFPSFHNPLSEILHTASRIECSESKSPQDESKFELPVTDVFKNCNCEMEDDTITFQQKLKGKPHSNGVANDVTPEKSEVMEEDEDSSHDVIEVKLRHHDSGLESNVNEESVKVSIDVKKKLTTFPGMGTYACSEASGNGCEDNPNHSCVASNESTSQEESEFPLDQLKYYPDADSSSPPDHLVVSGAAKRLEVEGVNNIARTHFTTYDDSLNKLKESSPGLSQHFKSNSKAGDDCHADVYDVHITEKNLGAVETTHGFDLSSVKQASKMVI